MSELLEDLADAIAGVVEVAIGIVFWGFMWGAPIAAGVGVLYLAFCLGVWFANLGG